jgi:hypothetical protein
MNMSSLVPNKVICGYRCGDFDLKGNEHPGTAKRFEDEDLQVLPTTSK